MVPFEDSKWPPIRLFGIPVDRLNAKSFDRTVKIRLFREVFPFAKQQGVPSNKK
jgi:hypothetical protein